MSWIKLLWSYALYWFFPLSNMDSRIWSISSRRYDLYCAPMLAMFMTYGIDTDTLVSYTASHGLNIKYLLLSLVGNPFISSSIPSPKSCAILFVSKLISLRPFITGRIFIEPVRYTLFKSIKSLSLITNPGALFCGICVGCSLGLRMIKFETDQELPTFSNDVK